MTSTYAETSRRRRIIVPAPAESASESTQQQAEKPSAQTPKAKTPQTQAPQTAQQPQDPPIYRALLRTWAKGGRTLPGRHDPEWVRLVAPSATYGYGYGRLFTATRDQRGDER
ncbi:hypothetical protein GCM10010094_70420 [Streptomyces flaveus]|uniref:Uncharacterized protein n=1 Tax=Streptomyces flaveus TaxID=66370 RepID=A0A917VMA3_9ACTN|nr:hypothetical protein GCM10010094_70420 [Streptomyces flaveus]